MKEKLLREKYPTIPYFHFLQSLLVQGKINTPRSTTSSFVLLSFGQQSQKTQEKQRNKSPPPQKTPPSHEKTPRRANLTARKHSRMPYFPQDSHNSGRFSDENISVDNFFNPPPFVSQIKNNTRTCRKNKKGANKKIPKTPSNLSQIVDNARRPVV